MQTKLEKVENNIAEFQVTIPAADFEEATVKAYKKNANRFNLPGFRKGKAPKKMIEQFYGVGVFYEDAINILLPDAYDKAVEEIKIEPVDRPEVDVTEIGEGNDVVVQFKVTVKPEVAVKDYKGIEIEKVEYNVSDEDVDAEIAKLQSRSAREITVEDRPVQDGDTVTMDFEGFVDGVAFDGGKGENHKLEIGSGQFIPGFEPQLVGMAIGEEKTIDVTFPTEYHSEDLAGKAAQFKVKISEVSAKELPDLDDEFAKDVSEFDTLAELKADTKIKLEEQAKNRQKVETENAVVEQLVEANPIDVPDAMVETQIQNIAKDYDMRLSQQGLNLEKYFEITGMTIDSFKDQFKEQAITQVKSNLLLEAVSNAENMEINEEELDAEYAKMAESYKTEVDNLKMYFAPELLKKDMLMQKAIDFLVENAKLTAAKKASTKAKKTKEKEEE